MAGLPDLGPEDGGEGVAGKKEAGVGRLDPLGIPGQELHGGGSFPEEGTVDEALVRAGQGAEFGRESEKVRR